MGMNLHYLPPVLRAKLLDGLLGGNMSIARKYIEPTIHRYLNNHVRSQFALVERPEWEIATFLPTADFRKATAAQVYRDSRKRVN